MSRTNMGIKVLKVELNTIQDASEL